MHTETQAKRLRRGVTKGLTLGTAAATAIASLMLAPAANAADVTLDNSKAPSAAHGQALALDGLGLPLLGAAGSTSEFGGQQGGLSGLDLSVLGQEIELGTITLPLLKDPNNPNSNGLLELGDASLLRGYSAASKKTSAVASSGLITDEGALNLAGAPNDELNAARVDLTALLDQLGLSGITDGIIDELSLELGAASARVEKTDEKLSSQYTVAGLEANVGAPLVGGVTDGLDGVVSALGGTLNGLVGKGGVVDGVLGSLTKVINSINILGIAKLKSTGIEAQVHGLDTLVDNVLDELIRTPLSNKDGSVNVDLQAGTVSLDLAALAMSGNGYENLNDLPANTSLLNDKTVTAITNGVTEALLGDGNANSLVNKLTAILTDHLWNSVTLNININVQASLLFGLLNVVKADVGINGSLAEFAGYDGQKLKDENIEIGADLLGIKLGALVDPIVGGLLEALVNNLAGPLLTTVTKDVIGQVQPLVSGLVSGLTTPLLQTLEPVLTQVATVTINDQPAQGDLGAGSHTTNALAVKVLPALGKNAVTLELGNASVKAADIVTSLTVSPNPVKQGGKVTVKGDGYGATENVTLKSALGADKTIKTNASGAFTAEWAVPAKQAVGSVKFTATGVTSKRTATATVKVEAAGTGANAGANSNAGASAKADANANASASASAAADGQATAAAQAAAQADASSKASAKASANAQAAAKAAANQNASTNASSKAEAAAKASAQAAANSKNDSDSAAEGTAAANSNAGAAAKAAANQNASTNASSKASANSNASASSKADANANASASAAADSKANAAAKAAAMADNSSDASAKATAKATATAQAAAQAAAKAAAKAQASTNASTKAQASAQAAAQAAAHSKADSDSAASGTAQQSATAQAAAAVAANASASSDASGTPVPPTAAKCDVTKPRAKSPFLDVATGYKFYPEIDWMHCTKLSTGWKVSGGHEYRASADMTREAMAAFIFRMQAPKNYKAPKKSLFKDVKTNHKFYREIMWMKESGISTGYADGTYRPGSKLDRDAMAAFIFRINAPRNYAPKTQSFSDVDKNTKFYKEIEWMGTEGLSKGYWTAAGPEYRPKNGLSREAMAAFLQRLVDEYWVGVIPGVKK
ncbi:choice-of-anchor G family protein [Leucobacter sp. HY1908]